MFVSNRVDLTPIGAINCTTARIYLHKMHDGQTIWAVSVFLEPPQLRLNFIEITQNAIDADSEESSGRHLEDEASFTKFLQCANKLKSQFNTIYGAITKIASLNTAILRRDRPVEISGKLIVKNVTKIRENGNIDEANVAIGIVTTPTELLKNVAQLNLRKLKLQTEIEKVSEMFSNAVQNSTHQRLPRNAQSEINGTNGDFHGEKLFPIRSQRIRVGNLRTNSDKWVNLLLKKSPKSQHLNISWLKSLRATNLNISANVNGINITEDIYNQQDLVQNKIVNFFHCNHLIVKNSLNSIHINDFFGLFAKGRSHNSPSFHVDQVIVENIQEMNFDTFYQSLFLQNTSREIDGNLIFYNVTTVKDLEVRSINGKATDDLVTLHTNQIINSTIRINQFRVEHFVADTVNDIEFRRENLALIGKDNHFEGPIQLYGLYAKDVILAEGDEEIPDRIIGTHIDDLSQVYMGQVTLKGNLHVDTLQVASKNNFFAKIPFNMSSLGEFWYKGLDQDFSNVIFYGNITIPQIHTEYIDHHVAEDFLKVHEEKILKNGTFFLRSAHVGGNVKLNSGAQTTANILSDSCVRVDDRTVVRGVKNFTGNLTVENVITSHLNGDLIAKLVLKNFTQMSFPSHKHFSQLYVQQNLSNLAKSVSIDRIHGDDLRDLMESCLMIDTAENITFVQANEIQSRDIEVVMLNSVPFAKSIHDIEKMEIHVEIQGDVTFTKISHLQHVNGVNLDEFLPLVAQSSVPLQLGGKKNFSESVRILDEFTIDQINDHIVDHWLRNALVNGTNQIVKEKWTVSEMKAAKIDVDTINGIRVKYLMDSNSAAHFETNVQVEEMTVNSGDIYGRINIDFNRTVKLLKTPIIRPWGTLHVEKNAHWPLGSLSHLTELLTNAIHAHRDQEIVGEVHFVNASVNNLNARLGIQGISVENVAQDSLRRRNGHNQVIFGDKIFLSPIEVHNLNANDYLNVPIVNNVDILKLNATMLKKHQGNTWIGDQWTFGSKLKTKNLVVYDGTINNVLLENLAKIPQGYDEKLPLTFFHNLSIVGNLTVTFVDKMPLHHLILERAKKRDSKNQDFSGFITFRDVILADFADVFSINGLEINSLFLTRASHEQDVIGTKVCRGNLQLLGPSSVVFLNGRDIGDLYYNSLFLAKDHIVEDYGFTRVQLLQELRVKESLNGIHLDTFRWMENSSVTGMPGRRDIEEEIHKIMFTIGDSGTTSVIVPKKKRFIYFDYLNSTASKGGWGVRVVRSVNIDADTGWRNCTRRRYSVKMLEDNNIVIRQVESMPKITSKAWNGVEISANNHVKNCISWPETAENTTITYTVRHGGKVGEFMEMYPGRIFHVEFLKIKNIHREILTTIGSIGSNVSQIYLIGIDRNTPKVTIKQTLSIFSANTSVYVMEFKKHVYLVIGTPKITPDGTILVYKLSSNATEFTHLQTIEGNYFMIRCIDALGMIILSNRGSTFVNIYHLPDNSQEFKLFQSIKLPSTLHTLSTFALVENQFFVITLRNDYFIIYMYNYIEGWIQICEHQYPTIESLTPFSVAGEGYLLAIAANSSRAIAIFSQTVN